MTKRLDGFTDAAFAFALTLLVIGRGDVPTDFAELRSAMAEVPAFAIGFAIIAMFWFTHVRWRRYRGHGDARSVLLTFILIFLVLIYVRPLQAVALSLSAHLGAEVGAFKGGIGQLFAVYGAGFVAMAATLTALFADARRNPDLDALDRNALRGEIIIWSILTLTGVLSLVLALFGATERWSPLPYATLPFTIGLFVWRFEWDPKPLAEAEERA
ncbi:MAG TPA: TMEM175 family protein [Sphingomicrobium sp.]|nr:TMEM175 family protein [Sphingomicrobium sp.]